MELMRVYQNPPSRRVRNGVFPLAVQVLLSTETRSLAISTPAAA